MTQRKKYASTAHQAATLTVPILMRPNAWAHSLPKRESTAFAEPDAKD